MKSLKRYCDQFFKNCNIKDCSEIDRRCLSVALNRFLDSGKKEDAFCVYYCFAEIFNIFGNGYDKNTKHLLELICDYEMNAGVLVDKQRDHYSHSVFVFAMGLAVYARNAKFRKLFARQVGNETNNKNQEFLYRWGLTALFHDIGYPFEIVFEQIKSYTKGINSDGGYYPLLTYKTLNKFVNLDGNNINAKLGDEISRRLGIDNAIVIEKLNSLIDESDEYIDHAYFSAVNMYRNLSGHANEAAILDVCAAILLHNSFLIHKLKTYYDKRINPEEYPLAFLLMFCDELQDFGREGFGRVSKNDNLAYTANIGISKDTFRLTYLFDEQGLGTAEKRTQAKIDKMNLFDWEGLFDSVTIDYSIQTNPIKPGLNMSANFFKNIQALAIQIHAMYQSDKRGTVIIDAWDKLPLEYKLSNIEQAKSYGDRLDKYNYFYSDRILHYPEVKEFTKKQIETLARDEHKRWLQEKREMGWKYGIRDNAARLHPCVLPYEKLPINEQEKDKDTIRHLIPNLNEAGFRVYKLR